MDRGAWWAIVHGVAKSRTRLSNFPFTFHFHAEGSLGTRGDTETQSPLLAGGIQVEEGVSAMGSCPSGGNRAAGAAVAEQQGAGSPPPLRALLPARLGLAA